MSSSSSDEGHFDLNKEIFQILVLGEPGCGKTSFIRAFYNRNSPTNVFSYNGANVYPCKIEFQNVLRDVTLTEFLGDSQLTADERNTHLYDADAIVLMYAIDDPSSFQGVVDKWLNEITKTVEKGFLNLIILGNKTDLRIDQQVIERLSLNDQTPLTLQKVRDHFKDSVMKDVLIFLECSTTHVQSVLRTIRKIILEIVKTDRKVDDALESDN